MWKGVLAAWTSVYPTDAWLSQRPEEGTGDPETGVFDGFELPCRC